MRDLSVFLVDDKTLIRMMIAEMVEELGHRVAVEAGAIEEAKSLAQGADFDFAILDINVNGHSIWPVAQIVESRGVPFVFASGYGTTGLPPPFAERTVLRKPFVLEGLKEAIAAILDDHNRRAAVGTIFGYPTHKGLRPVVVSHALPEQATVLELRNETEGALPSFPATGRFECVGSDAAFDALKRRWLRVPVVVHSERVSLDRGDQSRTGDKPHRAGPQQVRFFYTPLLNNGGRTSAPRR